MRRRPETLSAALAGIAAAGQQRSRRTVRGYLDSPQGPRVLVEDRALFDFCSNDYLGLARHPALAEAQQRAASVFGSGSGAAHLIAGHSAEHAALEEELADFTGRQRALLFSTGYMANLGVIGTFAGRGEVVLQDRLSHASLLDGARLSGARLLRYRHGDADDARLHLQQHANVALLATDGVFSMDGDAAPLAALAAACRQHETWLLVDDAHGLGVVGAHGGGTLEAAGLGSAEVPLLMGTLGKALGSFGAFVAGDRDVIELLLQRARTYIYTTALPSPVAAATRAALRLCREESWRREQLRHNVARFRDGARSLDIDLLPSDSAIQPLLLGATPRASAVSQMLLAEGFWVGAIRPPTVPEGTARLRITLSAAHGGDAIDALLNALQKALRAVPSQRAAS